jgi:predicted nucleic acid-binding protein
MRSLLDVNALIALGYKGHVFHARARDWYLSVQATARGFHTSSITEIGFVRVSVVTGLQPDIATARQALDALKSSSKIRFELIPDDIGAAQLPAFVKKPQTVSEGHLFELARTIQCSSLLLTRKFPRLCTSRERRESRLAI